MLETPFRFEPCLLDDKMPSRIADLAVEMQRLSSGLGQGLHPDSSAELADMVRVMNCYYSNLIEGHNTKIKDIESALAGDAIDEERRHLALEAKAHVVVQRKIDAMWRNGTLPSPTSREFIRWMHREFYLEMPPEFRWSERQDGSRVEVVPGEFRVDHVAVGRHDPPSPERLDHFMDHFSMRYRGVEHPSAVGIVAIAAAHHRFNFIHPFLDGNGRVSRLMSHAMALKAGIGGQGLWSISRGLARGLSDRGEYKQMMDLADTKRHTDNDGRGNLSLSDLERFTEWFMSVAVDQMRFTAAMFDMERLEERYRSLVRDVLDDRRAPELVATVLRMGMLDRGKAALVLGTQERTARNTLSGLVSAGFLKSNGPKTPVRIAFPLDYRERLFPNLFTDVEVDIPEPAAWGR